MLRTVAYGLLSLSTINCLSMGSILTAMAAATCQTLVHYYANHLLFAISPSSGITGENIVLAAIKKALKVPELCAQRRN